MRLMVRPGGAVELTVPERFSVSTIELFLKKHSAWIEKSVHRMRQLVPLPTGRKQYLANKEAARTLVHDRLEYWNSLYKFRYARVAIKNTKSLWGSCSQKGNLNFSYKLLFLPRELVDYVIVHELCHVREHNHGKRFWNLVAQTQPEYIRLRKRLRTYVLR